MTIKQPCTNNKDNVLVPTEQNISSCPINICVSWYLVHSYLYYICNYPVIEDSTFDTICHRLYTEYDNITHPHKCFLSLEALKAGTGFAITENDYPTIVKNTAFDIMNGFGCFA